MKEQANGISKGWNETIDVLLEVAYFDRRSASVDGFNQDLKERDSLLNSVNKYLKGNE